MPVRLYTPGITDHARKKMVLIGAPWITFKALKKGHKRGVFAKEKGEGGADMYVGSNFVYVIKNGVLKTVRERGEYEFSKKEKTRR